MADFDSSLPVRTENPGDVVAKIADANTPAQQLAVGADGSINVTDNGGSLTVDGVDFDIRDLDSAQDSVEVLQATHDNLNANANIQVGNADVDNANPVPVSDAGGSLTVDATDLDIRDLDSAQDSVEVLQATHDNLNANANIQVGDADVGNANPVPVSDAGGSITVDATDLDIRDLNAAQDNVAISDGTDTLAINADGSLNITDNGGSLTVDATDLDIRDLSAAQDNVAISDGTDTLAVNADGSINSVVTATDLDIRDLTHVSDSVKIGDGTDFLAINADGSINVVPQEDSGTEIVNYDTSSAIAGGASDNHDWTSAAASKLYQVFASASGKMKVEVQIETAAASNTFNTIAVGFNSTSDPNIDISLAKYATVPNGARVRVIRTNRDNQAQDVYSTIVAIQG